MAAIGSDVRQKRFRHARWLMEQVLACDLPQKEYELAQDLRDKIDALIQWVDGVDYLAPERRGRRGRTEE